jgi:orotidine-5'-phosphate decarboxylase
MSGYRGSRLIVALDLPTLAESLELVERLHGLDVIYKVGYEPLFGYGDALRARLEALGVDVFIDAKLHDIPRTVEAAVRELVRPGVRIMTVHALGGHEMMAAAVEAAGEAARRFGMEPPGIFAVTILTSIAGEDLNELGLQGGPGENVMRLAALARDARCAGVVCSPLEVRDLKSYFGSDFAAICGGVRPAGSVHDDQKRVATPGRTVEAGADYLVVGRPITRAADPAAVVRAIHDEMRGAATSHAR